MVEHAAEEPAKLLEEGVELAAHIKEELVDKTPLRLAQEYANTLGPGLTTGAADDDPSGIATYSQAGAATGFSLIWLAPFAFPLMVTVQEMCARIGLVTGKGLAANMRTRFPAWVLYGSAGLLFGANVLNIGADLGAMAKAVQIVLPNLPFALLLGLFAGASLLLQIFTTYARYAKYLKYLTLVLFSYIAVAFIIDIDWHVALYSAAVPYIAFTKETMIIICAMLGTTISPYLFFWQTSQEVEEEKLRKRRGRGNHAAPPLPVRILHMRIDVWSGMFISNVIMFFIIAVSAATFAAHGITTIATADQAALALRPIAGEWASLLFALGIVGTGMLAVPVLAGSASYAISESFHWKTGLYRKLRDAHAFYGVIIIAMAVGFGINFIGIDPIHALIYSAVANGLIAPILLVSVILLGSDEKIMKEHTNSRLSTFVGWLTALLMMLAGAALFVV